MGSTYRGLNNYMEMFFFGLKSHILSNKPVSVFL